jgi:hypothetical protein
VSGHDVGFPDLLVKTTENSICSLLDESKEDAKMIFAKVWKCIKSVDLDTLYTKGGEEWFDFCDDVVICLCLRQVLFGTPIPVCNNPPTD